MHFNCSKLASPKELFILLFRYFEGLERTPLEKSMGVRLVMEYIEEFLVYENIGKESAKKSQHYYDIMKAIVRAHF